MEIKYKARELMERTMTNLRIIDFLHDNNQKVDGQEAFEVTAMVNSFQGALAYPWETLRVRHSGEAPWDLSLADMQSRWGFPNLTASRSSDSDPRNFRQLIRYLRNGLAHGNIEFTSSEHSREIERIEVWDWDPDLKQRIWGTDMTVPVMRQFLDAFVAFARDPLVKEEGEDDPAAANSSSS